ncbi:hexosaminidase [Amycolatopsis arida]|uniref:beta-N-acetylhexosaminidase n=1 Tax=Amycolatopsis arida TaxID=587909 RepID=A0A1I5Q5P6_9PSEU|nr:beta-N-acetylhexosaminidase [Amycolatopsis arida]TDX98717.1 hexosaminidase [Amycolatopsis arida]SFP41196.1 hexosaminidase [Amycolatopsis arida]
MQRSPARKRKPLTRLLAAVALCLPALALPVTAGPAAAEPAVEHSAGRFATVIPAPVEAEPNPGVDFWLSPFTVIRTQPGSTEAAQVGNYLAELLRPATGYPLPVLSSGRHPLPGGISLLLGRTDPRVGDQGYQLEVTRTGVTIRADTGAGLFAGVQTLRQLLPAQIEADRPQPRLWTVPGGRIVDHPRFAYRGTMLDLARHFHTPDEVKAYIDHIAAYKINYLHLHLTDDQGWRIQIDSWPRLAPEGGGPGTGVHGVGGGYLTKAEYRDLVAYAASRHITVVPEIDMPGHTNSALATYAELNCDGVAPPPRTDMEVGYSSLCIDKEITYRFVEDVIREVAELTPGPYLHIGGDEAHATSDEDYRKFMDRVMPLVGKYGKRIMGWDEIATVDPPGSAVPQFWDTDAEDADVARFAAQGGKVLLSPANKAYLDMKYNEHTRLGLRWAGFIEVRDAYEWNPGTFVQGVPERAVLGVEAPLWSETLRTLDDIEYMAFPRLPALAELGWSAWSTHDWESFRQRLAEHGPRLTLRDIDFYRSPQVPWR